MVFLQERQLYNGYYINVQSGELRNIRYPVVAYHAFKTISRQNESSTNIIYIESSEKNEIVQLE